MKILLMIIAIFMITMPLLAQEITPEQIKEVKQEFISGLEILRDESISEEIKQELIEEIAENLTKLWVLENATIENGLLKIYLESSDIFIDDAGILYFKSESQGYIKIGNDDYNLESDITFTNKLKAYKTPEEPTSIIQIAPKLGAAIITDLKIVDYDILFLIQMLKFNKINVDLGIGFRSAGIRIARNLTANFDIGLYPCLLYPRDDQKWKPAIGFSGSFKF